MLSCLRGLISRPSGRAECVAWSQAKHVIILLTTSWPQTRSCCSDRMWFLSGHGVVVVSGQGRGSLLNFYLHWNVDYLLLFATLLAVCAFLLKDVAAEKVCLIVFYLILMLLESFIYRNFANDIKNNELLIVVVPYSFRDAWLYAVFLLNVSNVLLYGY